MCCQVGLHPSLLLSLWSHRDLDVKKCVYESWHNDNLLVLGRALFWPYYFSSCENKRNPREAKGVSNSRMLMVPIRPEWLIHLKAHVRVKAQGKRKVSYKLARFCVKSLSYICCKRERKKRKRSAQSQRITRGHKSWAELKMTSHKALHGLQKHSGSGYQERLKGPREQDALLT